MIDSRRRQLFRLIWNDGKLSRSEIHARTGLTPNGVGIAAEAMLRDGLLRECVASNAGAGRPPVPLEIDPTRRHMIGLALMRDRVEICRLSLSGTVLERRWAPGEVPLTRLVPEAAALLREFIDQRVIGIGVSVTGFVDPGEMLLLLDSATTGSLKLDLSPIYDAAGSVPLVLENDMHALAARWLLTHRTAEQEDVLLAWIEDGHMGAAMLVNGRPNRGCATGANDLGHMRFFADTDRCFCGHVGCLERIVSTPYLRRLDIAAQSSPVGGTGEDGAAESLDDRFARFADPDSDRSAARVVDYLACGLANVVNFVRPHRLVVVSSFMRHPAFADVLTRKIKTSLLSQLSTRVTIDRWDEPAAASAEMAAWLAMAELLCGGWNDVAIQGREEVLVRR